MVEERIEDLAVNKEQPEKPKPVEVKIPDDILKIINDLKVKKNQLIQQFLNLSFQVDELVDKKNETRNKVKNTVKQIGQKIEYAFNKLKLRKRKNYRWQFNPNKNVFVGNLIPEKPKK